MTVPDRSKAVTVRNLTAVDRERWEPLWGTYMDFYRRTLAPEVIDLAFRRLCAREAGMFGLVAEVGGEGIVGFAHCVTHRSTWSEGGKCYLEDLYVDPASRGQGVAETLIEAAKARAREAEAARLYWLTQPYNGAARSLYDQVGHLVSRVVYESEL